MDKKRAVFIFPGIFPDAPEYYERSPVIFLVSIVKAWKEKLINI
jgi:hypothetical protein